MYIVVYCCVLLMLRISSIPEALRISGLFVCPPTCHYFPIASSFPILPCQYYNRLDNGQETERGMGEREEERGEGREKREEGRGKREEGRGKREEG
jgi:hypothetical protein